MARPRVRAPGHCVQAEPGLGRCRAWCHCLKRMGHYGERNRLLFEERAPLTPSQAVAAVGGVCAKGGSNHKTPIEAAPCQAQTQHQCTLDPTQLNSTRLNSTQLHTTLLLLIFHIIRLIILHSSACRMSRRRPVPVPVAVAVVVAVWDSLPGEAAEVAEAVRA